ncbi:MAG: S1C family serine protease [Brotaphodocola sp.]
MPEKHDPDKKRVENRHFINEKVVKRPLTRGQIVKRLLTLCFAAVLFGIVSAVSFVTSKSLLERHLHEKEPEESSISIPKDDPAESTISEQAEEAETETTQEPIREVIQSEIEKYQFTLDDVNSALTALRAQVQKADKGIVTVHSVQKEMDWFDNPVETSGLYAGAVIADTPQEVLILTPEEAALQADTLKVTFNDGRNAAAQVKQKDHTTGMAVISVARSDIEDITWNNMVTLPLGNSYVMREGDIVAAIGSPAGVVHSMDFGQVSYVMKNAQMVDQLGRIIYADVHSDIEKGTFVINTAGELIGWTIESQTDDSNCNMSQIMGVSGYKGILEKLTNGQEAPYFGIIGQSVTEAMGVEGLTTGVYVMNPVADGPAYNAGIQSGDIITKVNGKEMISMREFQTMIESLACGQDVSVTVKRNGRETYTELQFTVTVGVR